MHSTITSNPKGLNLLSRRFETAIERHGLVALLPALSQLPGDLLCLFERVGQLREPARALIGPDFGRYSSHA